MSTRKSGPRKRYADREAFRLLIPKEIKQRIDSITDNTTEWILTAIQEKWLKEQSQIKEKLMTDQIPQLPTEILAQRLDELKVLVYLTREDEIERTAIEDELRAREAIPPRITRMQPHEDDF